MVTNGDVLDTNRLMQLFQSGLNKLDKIKSLKISEEIDFKMAELLLKSK